MKKLRKTLDDYGIPKFSKTYEMPCGDRLEITLKAGRDDSPHVIGGGSVLIFYANYGRHIGGWAMDIDADGHIQYPELYNHTHRVIEAFNIFLSEFSKDFQEYVRHYEDDEFDESSKGKVLKFKESKGLEWLNTFKKAQDFVDKACEQLEIVAFEGGANVGNPIHKKLLHIWGEMRDVVKAIPKDSGAIKESTKKFGKKFAKEASKFEWLNTFKKAQDFVDKACEQLEVVAFEGGADVGNPIHKKLLRIWSEMRDVVKTMDGEEQVNESDDGSAWFDDHGELLKPLPGACIMACSGQGRGDDDVAFWVDELGFDIDLPRERTINYLREYGAWEPDELENMDIIELAEKVLWIFCNDLKEQAYDMVGEDEELAAKLGDDPSAWGDKEWEQFQNEYGICSLNN